MRTLFLIWLQGRRGSRSLSCLRLVMDAVVHTGAPFQGLESQRVRMLRGRGCKSVVDAGQQAALKGEEGLEGQRCWKMTVLRFHHVNCSYAPPPRPLPPV